MQIHPGSVTCPDFAEDPLGYYVWHLEHHPDIYRQFRSLADRYAARNPGGRISADMICHVLRYQYGVRAEGDRFAVNNNLTALYGRLYASERPHARISRRAGYLDALLPEEQARIDAAFEPLKERQEEGAA